MKKVIVLLLTAFLGYPVQAQISNYTYPYTDDYNHHYKKQENLYKDYDGDGVINLHDFNDHNPNIKYSTTPDYSSPGYYNNYQSSYYDSEREKTIYVGPRGGRYYINRNGSKTYIKD